MTQLPRIGDKASQGVQEKTWRVYGVVDDYGQPTRILLRAGGWRHVLTVSAEDFERSWQHWTPATQRNT